MRMLMAVSVVLAALNANADAPGPMPEEGVTPAAPANAEAAPRAAPQITAGDTSARAPAVAVPTGSMPNLRAREAADRAEQEALRRERELELQAASVHASECYRQWGEATCASTLK